MNRINVHNTYIRNVNVLRGGGNFNYAYAHNVHAVTATSRAAFTGGERINRGAAHITEASLRGAEVSNHVGFAPTRQSAFGASYARGNVAHPPMSVQNRAVMARTAPAAAASHMSVHAVNNNGLRPANTSRSWAAQGNTTDRGRAPEGFGSSSRNSEDSTSARGNRTDRPPWAGAGSSANYGGSRSNGNSARENYSGGNRSYSTPQRNTPTNRSYSAPSRTYSAPSRSYGGGSRGGGGGGASHGGGGGGHPHR